MNRASCPDKWPTVKWRCLLKYFSMGTQLLCKIIINLRDSSAPFWRKCLKQTYPEIIVGSQRRDSMVQVIIQETCVTWVMITFIRRLWTVEPWSMLSIGNWIMRHPPQRTGRHLQQKTANHLRLMELFLVWGSLINNQYISTFIYSSWASLCTTTTWCRSRAPPSSSGPWSASRVSHVLWTKQCQ